MSTPTLVWSYGGGVQSAAIGVLISQGKLPVPEITVMADTGREKSTTWRYLHEVMQPLLDAKGVKVRIASHELSRVDLFAPDGTTIVPAYTEEGRLSPFCSGEWKRDVCERFLRTLGVKTGLMWLGFSVDEWSRVKKAHRPWLELGYPLIDLFVNRAMCLTIIREAGLPVPQKSRCYMCPHQNDQEWAEVQADKQDWEKALQAEQEINLRDPEQAGLFLHHGRKPLRLTVLNPRTGIYNGKPCDTGNCFT